jgi:hypothetical protein
MFLFRRKQKEPIKIKEPEFDGPRAVKSGEGNMCSYNVETPPYVKALGALFYNPYRPEEAAQVLIKEATKDEGCLRTPTIFKSE